MNLPRGVTAGQTDRLPVALDDLRLTEGILGGHSTWAVVVHGVVFAASFAGDVSSDRVRLQAARDLLAYINDFMFAGCGGPYHRFAANDQSRAATCSDCGAIEKVGQICNPILLESIFRASGVDPEIARSLRPMVASD